MPAEPSRLLLIKLSSIGDVVHALPVAAALRRRFPRAYLAWAVKPAAADVLVGNPHLDEVLIVGGNGARPGTRALPPLTRSLPLGRALRALHFDVALDMQGLLKTALLTYLSGARVRYGFRNFQEGSFLFYNRRVVPDRKDVHVVEGYLGFATALGAPSEPVDFTIAVSEEDRLHAAGLVAGHGSLVALVPGARWRSKQWPPERFAAVAEALHAEFGLTSVVVGAGGDQPLAEALQAAAHVPVLDLTGCTTLKQLAALFARCALTVSNDTGPLYISSAMGTPTVGVFGPTDPLRLGPYGPGHAKVWPQLPCAPCRRRACAPLRCLEQITPARVLAAARDLLSVRAPEQAHGR